jgi:hypothetical protein
MANQVQPQDYVANLANPTRCVDDRADKQGESLGVQLPGASLHLMDLLLIALTKAGETVSKQQLLDMTQAVYASQTAKRLNLLPGVHIDDEHGHITEEAELSSRVKGCGYDSVRAQVLARLGVTLDYESGSDITKARGLGWGVQVLTGEHNGSATAAVNYVAGTTLKTKSLWSTDRTPSFNYDIWVVESLAEIMENVLEDFGFEEAGDLIEDNAADWGLALYKHTLDILTQGKLGGDLIEIK